jgi:hypothetical protein
MEKENGRAADWTCGLVIRDYDETKSWFCEKLGFVALEDQRMSEEKRFLVVGPADASGPG